MDTTTNSRSRSNLPAFAGVAAVIILAVGVFAGYFIGHENGATHDTGTTVGSLANRASATSHNQADLMFAQMMMPHHSQALHMAKLAPTRSSSPAVKTLAASIEAAQQPELDKMNGWIKSWGGSLNTSHSSMSDGMMTDSDMSDLTKMSGTDFDHAFLTMMIQHHEGAIAMAENELEQGVNADALALAASIQMTQHAQVTQMQSLLE